MRIVSLLPSATDIVCSLGLAGDLAGRTHECDWPPGVIEGVPVVTRSLLDLDGLGSREIDDAVGARAHSGSSIYALDVQALRDARPDLILTQELCEVCAVSYREVATAARLLGGAGPKVVSLEPASIADILEHVLLVGQLAGAEEAAGAVVANAQARLARLREATAGRRALRCFCVEWLEPLYAAGHWVPEQVEAAGGRDGVAREGAPSRRVAWKEVAAWAPEALFLMPCGLPLRRALAEAGALATTTGWAGLPAVAAGRVWAVDGPAFFNRPGPRVVRGAEILAGLLHPDLGIELGPAEAAPLP